MAESVAYHGREQAIPASPSPELWAEFEDQAMAEGFTMIPNVVIRNPDLSDGAVRLYGLLLSYAWQDGFCFPGQERLATECGKGVKAIYRHTKELEAADLISVKHRPLHKGVNMTNVYTFKILKPSTCGTDQSKMSDRDRPKMSDNEYAVDKNSISPLRPPRGAEEGRKEKAGSVRSPVATSSSPHQPTPQRKKQAGQGRVKERSPRKTRGGVTSPAGIEAILSFEARTEGLDRVGWNVKNKRERLASIAKHWDFTSEEDPPMKLRRQISPDPESCDEQLRRLRKITSQADRKAQLEGLPGTEADSTPDARVQDTDSPSLPSTRKPDPNSLEGIVAADRAQEAEDTALLKAYLKAHPEDCTLDGF